MESEPDDAEYRVVWKNIVTLEQSFQFSEWVDSFDAVLETYHDVTGVETIDATLQRRVNGEIQESKMVGQSASALFWVPVTE